MDDPDDRVLVGVVNRKRDLDHLTSGRWYRIPVEQMPDGIQAEVMGFYLSRSLGDLGGAVRYYAPVQGVELAYRRWLLPNEADHPRADGIYYRVALGEICERIPPITNPSRYRVHFIRTTWGRFQQAATLHELYR